MTHCMSESTQEQGPDEGIDQPLDAGVQHEHEQDAVPGADAAADADPSQDRDRFAEQVRRAQEQSQQPEPQEPPD